MIYIGIDVAKDKHDCCIIDSDGVIINDYLSISNTRDGFELLYDSILSVLPDKGILVLCQYFGHKKSNFFMLHF